MHPMHTRDSLWRMSMDVRRMRHVIALTDHGSFARAATALGLSQSALSRSIQSVERDVGSNLFVRTASGTELTDSGQLFVARIRQIVQLTEDLDRDLINQRGLHSGHLHVGGGPFPAQTMVADALARFVADFPRIIVRMIMRDWDELLRRLRAREIELFVSEFSTIAGEADIAVEPLDTHTTFILGRRGHPLERQVPVSFADGLAYPYISLTRIPPRSLEPIRAEARRLRDAALSSQVFPALEFNALHAVKTIVLGSDALMVVPPACVADELESGRLIVLGSEPYLGTRYGIVTLKSQPLTTAGERFREYVLEAERAFTEREKELLKRWRPQPRTAAQAGTVRAAAFASRPLRPRKKETRTDRDG